MARRRQKPKQTTNRADQQRQPVVQTFAQHISELRKRLFIIVATCLTIGAVSYHYHDFFIRLIMAPLGDEKLIYLNPAGGFTFIFSVTFYITMILAMPIILYQLYAFIRPAIPLHTKRMSVGVALAALLLMVFGVAFGYLIAVPSGLQFLTNFASEYVTPSLTADSYLNFVLGYIFGVGLLFEVPLLLMVWHWISPLTPGGLLKSERFVIAGAFIVAAIISPTPDALNQTIIAVPIIIMYQFGVIAVLVSIARDKKSSKRGDTAHQQPEPRPVLDTPGLPALPEPPVLASELAPQQVRAATPIKVNPPRRRSRSVDGFAAVRSSRAITHRPVPAMRARNNVPHVVMQRQSPRLIDDFRPVRPAKAVDTNSH